MPWEETAGESLWETGVHGQHMLGHRGDAQPNHLVTPPSCRPWPAHARPPGRRPAGDRGRQRRNRSPWAPLEETAGEALWEAASIRRSWEVEAPQEETASEALWTITGRPPRAVSGEGGGLRQRQAVAGSDGREESREEDGASNGGGWGESGGGWRNISGQKSRWDSSLVAVAVLS